MIVRVGWLQPIFRFRTSCAMASSRSPATDKFRPQTKNPSSFDEGLFSSSGAVGESNPLTFSLRTKRSHQLSNGPVAASGHRQVPPSNEKPLVLRRRVFLFYGAMGNRTPDLFIANETLYQLSYGPVAVSGPDKFRFRGGLVSRVGNTGLEPVTSPM